ncbi:aminotransferase class III-fold pyridoxal phosphate-dependent enzyme [Streptomyces melanosporofaciens]|uniref:4-aminobutyrate aminotransferase n=1 Tax=Streptomyces melanosporofaciens TaxID=67327 RepID=A0A1H4KGH5_STRMJ|nr:aminotransferase class III-fold pyridoxal phosphate-dependent enzyme [Streptomyces melanosporofaciens]SEB57577.1 4-aminobutyrate aminotransferase [Streptomyces melanosporofaciens]
MTSTTTSDADWQNGPVVAPRLPAPVLGEVLERHFDLICTAQEQLGGEVDQNVKVVDESGKPHFVRVTHTEPNSVDIAWQNSMLRHLAATVPELPVPHLVPTTTGGPQATLEYGGRPFVVRVMTWLPGRVMADIDEHPTHLLHELGAMAGRLSLGLSGMDEPAGLATHDWDMRRAQEVVDNSLAFVQDQADVAHVRRIMSWYGHISPLLKTLPHSVVHQDLNDANILADTDEDGVLHISGIVDVGDSMFSVRAAEVAIAAGYAMVRKDDPLVAAAEVVAGFHSVLPLTAQELSAVYPLAAARLCMNAVTWNRRIAESGSEYGRTRMMHTWPTIRRIAQTPPGFAEAAFRAACSLPPLQGTARVDEFATEISALFPHTVHIDARPVGDLYDDIDWNDHDVVRAAVRDRMGGQAGVLGHLESSLMWSAQRAPGRREPATVRLGTTVLLAPGTEVRTPLRGVVEVAPADDLPFVLRHAAEGADVFTCWWHLGSSHEVGDVVAAGEVIGEVCAGDVEAGIGSGVQVQLIHSAEIAVWPPPRRIRPSERATWRQLSSDPAPALGREPGEEPELTVDDVVTIRARRIARSQRNYYARPMNLVRGRDVWFYDEDGLGYLDSLNNVTHVGHAEPRITAAAARQMRKLNTNSRFVYPQIVTYAEKLVATLPDPLEVVFLVCSGSEANDLALRIARQVTGRRHVVNIDGAYHGNTGVVTGISPNRYKGPGGQGAPPTTHEVCIPDRYRGAYGYDDPEAGAKYARDAARVIERIDADGRRPAAFIAESLMGTAGNIVFPDGYLAGAFAAARRAGALCISDEVQVGVGRLGPWWGFELQSVVPDIVTMGKPLGNGHPLAAVVTTRAIADAFDTGMKYFNTFGGNPVSCAIGEAVLDIVERDGLRARAQDVGGYFATSLRRLQQRQPIIGDVRAQGLYLGVELVRDRATKEPATREAFRVTELTKERGVVVFPNGVHDNVLKIKPP